VSQSNHRFWSVTFSIVDEFVLGRLPERMHEAGIEVSQCRQNVCAGESTRNCLWHVNTEACWKW